MARSVDIFQKHLREVLQQAAAHQGSAYIEVYQNCNIFNDGAFSYMTEKDARDDQTLYLEHDQPLVFGKEKNKGIRLNGTRLEVIELGGEFGPEDCLVWDETDPNPTIAFMAAQMQRPEFPTPIGVLRSVEMPTYESGVVDQIQEHIETRGQGTLKDLIYSGELWTVGEDGNITSGAGSS